MAFSMILCCIIEATESEIATLKKRGDKAADKPKGKSEQSENGSKDTSAQNKASQLTSEEIEVLSFKKFWDSSSEWAVKLTMDVVVYAKDNQAREHDAVVELLHLKQKAVDKEDVKILFAKNVWAPLRSRGWKATPLDGSTSEQQYSYGDEKVGSEPKCLETLVAQFLTQTHVFSTIPLTRF